MLRSSSDHLVTCCIPPLASPLGSLPSEIGEGVSSEASLGKNPLDGLDEACVFGEFIERASRLGSRAFLGALARVAVEVPLQALVGRVLVAVGDVAPATLANDPCEEARRVHGPDGSSVLGCADEPQPVVLSPIDELRANRLVEELKEAARVVEVSLGDVLDVRLAELPLLRTERTSGPGAGPWMTSRTSGG